MTTIAYRDGVLAADTMMVRGDVVYANSIVKIVRLADGRLAGAVGLASFNSAFLRWAQEGAEAGKEPEAKETENSYDTGLVVALDGSLTIYEPGGWFTCRSALYALGGGKEIAIGAMFAGADAEQAVLAACTYHWGTGAPITVLRLP